MAFINKPRDISRIKDFQEFAVLWPEDCISVFQGKIAELYDNMIRRALEDCGYSIDWILTHRERIQSDVFSNGTSVWYLDGKPLFKIEFESGFSKDGMIFEGEGRVHLF